MPVWTNGSKASKTDLSQALKEGGANATAGASGRRMRSLLVVSEMALAVLLLIGAGLMIKSFWRLLQGDLGLNPKNVLTMEVMLPPQKYGGGQQRREFLQGVMQRIENLPGVEQAGATNFLPLTGFWGTASFSVEGRPAPLPNEQPSADNRVVTDAIAQSAGAYLGVANIDESFTDSELEALNAKGIRGCRFTFVRRLGNVPDVAVFRRLVERIKPLGWHVDLYFEAADIPEFLSMLRALPVRYVIDHMGGVRAGPTHDAAAFAALIELLRHGRISLQVDSSKGSNLTEVFQWYGLDQRYVDATVQMDHLDPTRIPSDPFDVVLEVPSSMSSSSSSARQ